MNKDDVAGLNVCLGQAAYALKMYASEQTDEVFKSALQKSVHNVERAADTIEALQSRIEALEAALRRIKDATNNEIRAGDKGYVSRYGIHGIATKALEGE